MKAPRLTQAERHIAAACLEFVLAGEWPFETIALSAASAVRDKLRGWPPLERGEPSAALSIGPYLQCKLCLEEVSEIVQRTKQSQSPALYTRFDVGFTPIGLQVWCRRHEINVVHIDFEGIVHPANLKPAPGDLTNPQKC